MKKNNSDQLHEQVSHSIFPTKMHVSTFLRLSIRNLHSLYLLNLKMESILDSSIIVGCVGNIRIRQQFRVFQAVFFPLKHLNSFETGEKFDR